jgi:hypothetical protein
MRRKTVRRNDALPLRISYADILRTDPESVEHVRESKPPVAPDILCRIKARPATSADIATWRAALRNAGRQISRL